MPCTDACFTLIYCPNIAPKKTKNVACEKLSRLIRKEDKLHDLSKPSLATAVGTNFSKRKRERVREREIRRDIWESQGTR